jgi:hypothetical protein
MREMLKHLIHLIALVGMLPSPVLATGPVVLTEKTYSPGLGVLVVQFNWGRKWKCGQFENAQLQAITFTRSPIDEASAVSLEFKTPSKLFVDDKIIPQALVIQPGEYVLTAYDVKAARSVSDVVHMTGSRKDLIRNGKPVGGTFQVGPGEIVYVGHFGLDCDAEPFLWRTYVENRQSFERFVGGFRKTFPFVRQIPVQFRLFASETFGHPFELQNPTVE